MEVLAIITTCFWLALRALMLSNERNKEEQEQQNEINK
jgi:hypothetical protein